MIRKVSREERKPLCILGDLQGPKIRTSKLKDHQPVLLKAGERLTITPRDVPGTASAGGHHLQDARGKRGAGFAHSALRRPDRAARARSATATTWSARSSTAACWAKTRASTCPAFRCAFPRSLTRTSQDLEFALKNGVDAIAVSFVRTAEDVRLVRNRVSAYGGETWIIAKLEKPQAIEHLDAILHRGRRHHGGARRPGRRSSAGEGARDSEAHHSPRRRISASR